MKTHSVDCRVSTLLMTLLLACTASAQTAPTAPPIPLDTAPKALPGETQLSRIGPSGVDSYTNILRAGTGAPAVPAGERKKKKKKSKKGSDGGADKSLKFLQEPPVPGFSFLTTKKSESALLRTGRGLSEVMPLVQQGDQPAAVSKLGEILGQLDAAKASNPEYEEGKQCAATRAAFKVGQETLPPPGTHAAVSAEFANSVAAAQKQGSPILLDLNLNGIADVTTPEHTGSRGAFVQEGAVRFDVTGRGRSSRFEWLKPGCDGLLAIDTNRDGVVDDSTELFGDSDGFADGYARLALLDANGDGMLTGEELSGLSVWIDDGDGLGEPGELHSLSSKGITRLGVKHNGYVSSFEMSGRVGKTWDWFPRYE